MSIRWRLTLFNALAIGAILLLLGLALFFLLRAALLADVEDTARGRALGAARTIGAGDDLTDDDIEKLTLDGVFVIVRDREGKVLNQTVNLTAKEEARDLAWRKALTSGKPASGTAELSRQAPDYVYAVPVNPANGPARVIEAGKSFEGAQEAVGTVATVLAGVLAGAFLLSTLGAYYLARTALRPVDAVVRSAREMTESDLGKRLPVTNPNDEIGRLATTMNGFLARLEAAFARREETLARQRRFAADASHELRTPLTAIGGHARMLDEWALDDPKRARQSVAAIRREAGRMRNLVEALLALTRGDEDAPLNVERCDLAAVAEDAVQMARASADVGPAVEYSPPEHEVEANFDRERVLQLAGILLDNAVKYTPEDGRIVVRVSEDDGWAILEVSDTGVGIAEDQGRLIFDRFHRADPSRADGGAGLGLSIARQIAESHGGAIRVRSKPGQGSSFKLFLPRR